MERNKENHQLQITINPPYQDNTLGENETYAPPVNAFIDASYEVADKVELIHPARFLFNAGSTPAWNQKMLSDEHFKVLYYEQDSSKVFATRILRWCCCYIS